MNPTRTNTLILSFSLLVVMLGYGMVLPIMPFYIEKMGAGGQELGFSGGARGVIRVDCQHVCFWIGSGGQHSILGPAARYATRVVDDNRRCPGGAGSRCFHSRAPAEIPFWPGVVE